MEARRLTDQQSVSLEQVQERFGKWRSNRNGRPRIPESLWEAAAYLYPAYCLNRIARSLGLDYTKLKQRVAQRRPEPCRPAAQFIDLGFIGSRPECGLTIEIHHRNGTLSVQGAGTRELMKLARLFSKCS
ncbi:MAG: hypothetical protein H5U10_17410 [Desulfacinum sp.]|nr:hypothetical protein [Desulfacinum sp.]